MPPAHLVGVPTHYVGMDVIISHPVLEDIITVSHSNKIPMVSLIHVSGFVIEDLTYQKCVSLKFSISIFLQPDHVEQAESKSFNGPTTLIPYKDNRHFPSKTHLVFI